MKFGSGTIGTILFTAIGTAAFVWMAKRPAVDATAMTFGIPNTSQTSTNSGSNNSEDKTTPNTTNTENTSATSGVEPTNTATPDTSNQEPTNSAPAENNAPITNPTENITTPVPATPAPESPAIENIAPPSIPVEPIKENEVLTSPSSTSAEPPTSPSTTIENTEKTDSTTTEAPPITTRAVENSSPKTTGNSLPAQTIKQNLDSGIQNTTKPTSPTPETVTTDKIKEKVESSDSQKPQTVKVPANRIFGNNLPSYITDQLPEMIDVPIDLLIDRSAAPE